MHLVVDADMNMLKLLGLSLLVRLHQQFLSNLWLLILYLWLILQEPHQVELLLPREFFRNSLLQVVLSYLPLSLPGMVPWMMMIMMIMVTMMMMVLGRLGVLGQKIMLFVHLLQRVIVLVEKNVLIFMEIYAPAVENIACILTDLWKGRSI